MLPLEKERREAVASGVGREAKRAAAKEKEAEADPEPESNDDGG